MNLIKIPFSAGGLGKTKGCEKAPDVIEEELNDLMDRHRIPFETEDVAINNSNLEETSEAIQKIISKQNSYFVAVGGDHSITYSVFRAFSKNNPGAGILVFDSHADTFDDFALTHENYLRKLISEGLDPKNVIIVGLRNIHKQELQYLYEKKIRFFDMKRLHSEEDAFDSVMEMSRSFPSLYISIDIDVVDPAFAPGTGYREPGGFTSREFLHLIQRLKNLRNIKAIDVVEVNPEKDINNITSRLAANIISEMIN